MYEYKMNSYDAVTEKYALWLGTLGYSNGSVSGCKYKAILFFDWLEERKKYITINQLTNRDVVEYYKHLEVRPNKHNKESFLSANTLNQTFFAIDKLLELLHQYGMETAP